MGDDDDKEEPFVLEKDQCWVEAENKEIKAKHMIVVTFGPVSTANIVGRAMYCLRTAVVHGPVRNSDTAMGRDSPILAIELDVEEMAKNHNKETLFCILGVTAKLRYLF
ncbi:hypothetical protein DY000_02034931 [Brassica cretica]|uniref:Uncharacterized protein n=1 Tax=Brassica cretica TaxID=69181 RepID=A0ABQ7DLB3_BRACR|nr:hypothetical protein DY000_02034931 [Brassica cretica]